jgi:hypothetical protein
MPRFQVILTNEESERFAAYCARTGHKKSTLAARLIREYLNLQGFAHQPDLLSRSDPGLERVARRTRPGS